MKLSIIIVSYNEAQYLPQCIESCRKLGLEDYEIVIGDDGSSDGSIDMIQRWHMEDPAHIRFFVQDRSDTTDLIASLRVSNLLFRAMQMASGDYLHILSGDDYLYETGFFADGMAFLRYNPDHSAYVGAYDKVWETKPKVHLHPQFPPILYWGGAYIHISAFLFRKKAVEDEIFLERFCDDTGLSYSLAFAGKWKYCADTVFAYRQREASITHASDELQLSIVELMLLQDTLNKGKLKRQSLARFSKPAHYVFEHRDMAMLEKYRKYRNSCSQYAHDILGDILEYDEAGPEQQCRVNILLLRMKLWQAVFTAALFVWRAGQKCKDAFTRLRSHYAN